MDDLTLTEPVACPGVLERATDYPMWAWCWLAWRLVMVLPLDWTWGLLPFAGYYAFSDQGRGWRWSNRVRERDLAQAGAL